MLTEKRHEIILNLLSEKRSIIIDEDTSVSVDVNPKNMM